MRKPVKVKNMHKSSNEFVDPYYWVKNMKEEEKEYFKIEEELYYH